MRHYKSGNGAVFAYETEAEHTTFAPPGLAPMMQDEVDAYLKGSQTVNSFIARIDQDKAYLASTDYIVTKIAEASALGQDTQPLLEQYATDLEQRELARVRIRANEGRA